MEIEQRKTSDLIPYARNAKLHNEQQIAQIAASIKEFGFNDPVEITVDNVIIAGHGRVLAAQKLGLTEVPVVIHSHLNDNQRKAYTLLNNRLAETGGGWDTEMLKLELDELPEFDLSCFDDFFSEAFKEIDEISHASATVTGNQQSNEISHASATVTGNQQSSEMIPPDDFKEFDADIETDYCCPKCGYEWSGKAK